MATTTEVQEVPARDPGYSVSGTRLLWRRPAAPPAALASLRVYDWRMRRYRPAPTHVPLSPGLHLGYRRTALATELATRGTT